jgi:hypothetical protein
MQIIDYNTFVQIILIAVCANEDQSFFTILIEPAIDTNSHAIALIQNID